jgi:hypothetical protein
MGIVTRGAWLAATAALFAQSAPSQAPSNGSIEGRVVNASSGQGISGARVRIQSGREDPLFTTTDTQGFFQLSGLELKSYLVSARCPGFIGSAEWDGPSGGEGLRLIGSSPIGQVRLELRRYGAIEGRVTDGLGVPAAGVSVEALQRYPADEPRSGYVYKDGSSYQYAGRQTGQTNDLGEYRLAPLPAGSYYIYVLVRPTSTYYNLQPEIRPPADARERPTFYPHALRPSEAKPVELAEGKELRVDVQIVRQAGVKVGGRVLGLTAGSPSSVFFQGLSPGASNLPAYIDGDRFTAAGVLPGKYVVGVGEYIAGEGTALDLVAAARRTVDVGTEDLDGIDLTLAPAPDVEGAVVFESGCAPAPLWIQLTSDTSRYAPRSLATDASGHFVLPRVFPGKYKAYVGVEGALHNAAKSIKLGDAEVLADGFDVTAKTKAPLRITMGCPGR